MRTEVKAALAAVAGGALLIGGAGTLAYWKDSETVTGTDVSSGTLTLTHGANQSCTSWALDDAAGSSVFSASTTKVVPGDVLTRTCTYTVGASGDHLAATLSLETPTFDGAANDLSAALAVTSAFTVDGTARSTVTSADNSKVVQAAIKVTFSSSTSGTSAQGLTATLDDLTVSLTQTHA